jgi:N-acetyl-S-(2-succino)cysteine monooxygenase
MLASTSNITSRSRAAERGKFDMIFVADMLAVREGHMDALCRSAIHIANFEPLTLITALAPVTKNIGLVATASTSYNEPYHVARKFASLDHLTAGRAGWNIVTSGQESEAHNFGRESRNGHAERYERAQEFTRIVLGLWDSWDDDAFVRDKGSGVFFDPDKLHQLNHKGKFLAVRGPLNVPRPPQSYPVLVQAGMSEDASTFSAEFADVLFTSHLTLEKAKEYAAQVRGRVSSFGRAPEEVKILPGLGPIVGRTEAEERFEFLNSVIDPIVARDYLSMVMRIDLRTCPSMHRYLSSSRPRRER